LKINTFIDILGENIRGGKANIDEDTQDEDRWGAVLCKSSNYSCTWNIPTPVTSINLMLQLHF